MGGWERDGVWCCPRGGVGWIRWDKRKERKRRKDKI